MSNNDFTWNGSADDEQPAQPAAQPNSDPFAGTLYNPTEEYLGALYDYVGQQAGAYHNAPISIDRWKVDHDGNYVVSYDTHSGHEVLRWTATVNPQTGAVNYTYYGVQQ